MNFDALVWQQWVILGYALLEHFILIGTLRETKAAGSACVPVAQARHSLRARADHLRLARRHCDLPSDAAGGDKEQVVNTTSLNDRAAGSPPAARQGRAGSPPVEIRVRWARAKTGKPFDSAAVHWGRVNVGRDPSPYDRKSVDCGSDGVRAGGLHCRRRPRQRGPAPNEGVP